MARNRTDVTTSTEINATRRRLIFLALNLASLALLSGAMAVLLGNQGWRPVEMLMQAAFMVTLPWLTIGFWNALIGFVLTVFTREPVPHVAPSLLVDEAQPITSRTAVIMTVRNEEPERALTRLRAVQESLAATPFASLFEFHLLSDTSRPELAAREVALIEAWRREAAPGTVIEYRRREANTGFKAGNVMEFCERCGERYDFFVPLDADSVMDGSAIIALVRRMEANPQLGILQGLVVGMPSMSAFARLFQFGMRHGMRSYTMGSAWWQGDCGPFWGHNALIRVAAFRDHCKLPVLPGGAPLGGHILSHDQVEAVLMRRAGYAVRVWPVEDQSFEENPPSLPDFVKRDLRWCQGNMQYFQLLNLPGLKPVSRVQLGLAILMYTGAPAWMLFILTSVWLAISDASAAIEPVWLGIILFITILTMSLTPKLMGVAQMLCNARQRRRYGGTGRILAGTALELIASTLFAPVVALNQALFMAGLPFGRQIRWEAQRRDGHVLSWRAAFISYWPQTLFGLTLTLLLGSFNHALLPWAAPTLLGFLLVIPLAVFTAAPATGRAAKAAGLFDIPEDREQPEILARIGVGSAEEALSTEPAASPRPQAA
jgi:membrane glycosyltransferase